MEYPVGAVVDPEGRERRGPSHAEADHPIDPPGHASHGRSPIRSPAGGVRLERGILDLLDIVVFARINHIVLDLGIGATARAVLGPVTGPQHSAPVPRGDGVGLAPVAAAEVAVLVRETLHRSTAV